MKDSGMTGNGGMNPRVWAALLTAFFLATALPGCFNPVFIETPDSEDPSPVFPPNGAAPGLGASDPFTITVSLENGPGSRSVVGPDTAAIQYGKIRNIAQIIVMDEEGKTVVFFDAVRRYNEDDKGADFRVENVSQGNTYRFLILMGHLERNYTEETETPGENFVYTDKPPTLLAAGSTKTMIYENQTSITITMYPLVVDTVFETRTGRRNAKLGKPGVILPLDEGPSDPTKLIWTIGGRGFTSLINAHAGISAAPNDPKDNIWDGHYLEELKSGGLDIKTSIKEADNSEDLWQSASAGGLGHNQITLNITSQDWLDKLISASFNLKYVPFWKEQGENWTDRVDPDSNTWLDENGAPAWIIRNGVNDEAQNNDTVFPDAADSSPWNGTTNGNGAVLFTVTDLNIDDEATRLVTDGNLTPRINAPEWGRPSVTTNEDQYTMEVISWDPPLVNGNIFWLDEFYTVTLNLRTLEGWTFNGLDEEGFFYHDEGLEDPVKSVTYDYRGAKNAIVTIKFKPSGSFSRFSGMPDRADSVVDLIKMAQKEDMSTFNVNLGDMLSSTEVVELRDDRDLSSKGLVINREKPLEEEPLEEKPLNVTIDGDGVEIYLGKAGGASLITVESNITLTLRNITFKGTTGNNHSLIKVDSGGTLILGDGAVIRGNTTVSENGGGVLVVGTLILRGGTICKNTAEANEGGGGVYVAPNGTFTMERGTICGNNGKSRSAGGGGGVYVAEGGTFIMEGGTISKNTAEANGGGGGGGVHIGKGGTFIMEGGVISGNKGDLEDENPPQGYFTAGAAVLVNANSNFTKTGGTIYGLDAGENANRIIAKNTVFMRPNGVLMPVPESVICVVDDSNIGFAKPYLYYNHTLDDTATGQVSYTGKGGSGEGTYSWGDTNHPWMGPLFQ